MDNNMDLQLNFNNFDPEEIQVEETINAVFIVDVSPSITGYVDDLNNAFNEFVEEMQKSHVHDRLFVSIIEFCEQVEVKSGFQPITAIKPTKYVPRGVATSLYDATMKGMDNAISYREQLEDTGVNCKTLIYVITDGMDNHSSTSPNQIKDKLGDILKDESNAFSFTTIMFGVGDAHGFETAKDAMGIQHLAKVGTTGKEIRKMINFISSSISSTSSGQNPVSQLNF